MAEGNGDQAPPRRTAATRSVAPEETVGGSQSAAPSAAAFATLAPRRRRYLVGVRPFPAAGPMSAEAVLRALDLAEDTEILRHLRPHRGPGAPAAGGGETLVVRMDERRGEALRRSAPFNLIVEPDAPLRYGDTMPALRPFAAAPPMPFPSPGREVVLRVVGDGDRHLSGAGILVFGDGTTIRAVTDGLGQAVFTLYDVHNGAEGGPEPAIAVYVKPAADHWDRFICEPALGAGPQQLKVRPLAETVGNLSGQRVAGWGARLLKRDLLADGVDATGVKVGLVDSGCDNTHPLLRHVQHGAEIVHPGRPQAWSSDPIGHGTHCAGILVGQAQTPQGILGMAPKAELHVLKVFPGGRTGDLIAALDEAVRRQLDVLCINALCEPFSELLAAKLAEAQQSGVACIVGAGSAGAPAQCPGNLPGVFAVSAIGRVGEFPSDSLHALAAAGQPIAPDGLFAPGFAAAGLHVAAAGPGVAIVSAVPGGGYAAWDGNAQAAAHVAGCAALLLAHHPLLQGPRGPARVAALFEALRAACTPLPLLDPTRVGAGVPDLQRALPARPGEAGGFGYGFPGYPPPGYLAGLLGLRGFGI
jgi:subtilisin